MLGHLVECLLPNKSDPLEHLVTHAVGFTVFDGFELRRNPGFKRKLSKKRRCERVQRLDLQTAGSLQRVREKRPGSRELRRRQHVLVLAEVEQTPFQFSVGQHRPFAEPLNQPVLHVRRRRVRERNAKNSLRRGAGQKKPGDPVGENPGLARTGVRGDPRCRFRICRPDLRPRRVVESRTVFHPTASVLGSSESSHSPYRAR